MGLYGILVVTNAPARGSTAAGTAYPGVTYNAEVPLVFSEIDPVQNNAVNAAVNTAGFSETASGLASRDSCGDPASSTYNTCYPPAVNYTPLYYLINGVAFNKYQRIGIAVRATSCGTLRRSQPATSWCALSMPARACTFLPSWARQPCQTPQRRLSPTASP